MKIVLIGANGTIGELVQTALASTGHEIVKVGRKSGDFQVDIESRENIRQFYQAIGPFDAVAAAAAVSGALEGFARAAAVELPKGLRINVVSPTILKESEAQFGPFFPGVIPVEAGEWQRPTNARFWRCKPAASTKLLELAHRLFAPGYITRIRVDKRIDLF